MAWSAIATAAMLFVVGVASSPVYVTSPSRELLPPKVPHDTTLATELMPPPEDQQAQQTPFTLFLINVFALKNVTAEDSNDVLQNDILKEVPDDISEPLAVFVLVVEADNETEPVSLDEMARDLVDEGFTVEKIGKDGETHLIKVDLNTFDSNDELESNADRKIEGETEEKASELEQYGKLMKLRRRRSVCVGCDLSRMKRHLHKHRHGYGYDSQPCLTCGGGYPSQPTYPRPQIDYIQPQYPQPCNTCGQNGGGGGGYGQGNSNAYASASAQASASSYGGRY